MCKKNAKFHEMTCQTTLMLIVSLVISLPLLSTQALAGNRYSSVVAQCGGTHNVFWSPGETNSLQNINVKTDTALECTLEPSGSPISVTTTESFMGAFSCASNQQAQPQTTWTLHWSDGTTSTFVFNAMVNSSSGNPVIDAHGAITAGKFQNDTADAKFTLNNFGAQINSLCSTSAGVQSASGTATLTISSGWH